MTASPCRHIQGEGKEEALEQLAILVGAEHVDDVAEKFKVRLPTSAPPTLLQESFGWERAARCLCNSCRPLQPFPLLQWKRDRGQRFVEVKRGTKV